MVSTGRAPRRRSGRSSTTRMSFTKAAAYTESARCCRPAFQQTRAVFSAIEGSAFPGNVGKGVLAVGRAPRRAASPAFASVELNVSGARPHGVARQGQGGRRRRHTGISSATRRALSHLLMSIHLRSLGRAAWAAGSTATRNVRQHGLASRRVTRPRSRSSPGL